MLLRILRWSPLNETELQSLQNIQLGCIECLSIVVNLSASRPRLQPLGTFDGPPPLGTFDDVAECLLQLLLVGEETESVRICVVNVFTSRSTPPPFFDHSIVQFSEPLLLAFFFLFIFPSASKACTLEATKEPPYHLENPLSPMKITERRRPSPFGWEER